MKADQGFKKLLLVPFGMSLDALIKKFKAFLVANKRKIPQFDKTQLALDETTPIWTWDGYNGADTSGALIYHPTEFTNTNHGGQTKQEILDKQQTSINQNQASGWNILFLQSGEDGKGIRGIPRNGSGVPVGKEHPRPDIEAGKSPNDYLKDQLNNTTDQSSPYHGEQGMTPEEWIIAFMTHLEETESLMDDWQDNVGSIAYLTGAYFQDSGFVPVADWVRDRRQVGLGGDVPAYQDGNFGVRSSVRVM